MIQSLLNIIKEENEKSIRKKKVFIEQRYLHAINIYLNIQNVYINV